MRKLAAAAAVLLLAGCATVPVKQQTQHHQVNRAKKADKGVMPKKADPAPMPTPNQVVTKRWYDGFRVRWLH
jgi:hypothetical protein